MKKRTESIMGMAFFGPALVLLTIFLFLPMILTLIFSFTDFFALNPGLTHFVGLDNYIQIFKDDVFWGAFVNNIYIVIACIIGQIGLAFIIVLMVNSKLAKFKGIHRTFAFFPSTVSAVCIGFIWMMIYDYKRGILNWALEIMGKGDFVRVWLNEPKLVLFLICIPLIWQFIGYYMVILLSAISSVDPEIFEVAELDGASAFQRAIYIVFPLIKNTILVCITLCVAGNMKVFDHIYTMTQGGPGNSSMVMAMYGYKVSFAQQNMGYGSAISVGIFVVSLIVIAGVQKLMNLLMKDKGVE